MDKQVSPYDPIETIHKEGELMRGVKYSPLYIRLPFSLLFLVGPSITIFALAISWALSAPSEEKALPLLGAIMISVFMIPMFLAGVFIIIGKRG